MASFSAIRISSVMNQFCFQPTSMTSPFGAMLLACLLAGCGDDSVAADPVSGETLPALIIAQADVGDDAASDATDSTDMAVASPVSASPLKRFGVMPHFGDLDTMVDRRVIRVLTVYGPGRYFLEDGPRGTVQEYAEKLQKVVNTAYKTGLLTVQVAVIPVARDQLFPALQAGYGDIVMAGTTITESRRAEVDFTDPVSKLADGVSKVHFSASTLRYGGTCHHDVAISCL